MIELRQYPTQEDFLDGVARCVAKVEEALEDIQYLVDDPPKIAGRYTKKSRGRYTLVMRRFSYWSGQLRWFHFHRCLFWRHSWVAAGCCRDRASHRKRSRFIVINTPWIYLMKRYLLQTVLLHHFGILGMPPLKR